MSDLKGWKPEWDEYLAERGLKRRKPTSKAYGDFAPGRAGWARWIGRTDSPKADNSFQARTYRMGDDQFGYHVTNWKSPPFADPITAFVYAETCNWGQS